MKGQGCHLRKTGRWLPNDHTGEEKDNFQRHLSMTICKDTEKVGAVRHFKALGNATGTPLVT